MFLSLEIYAKQTQHFLRETATNLLCKSSGMSVLDVLVAFHCKLERPIRGCDLKVIEKMLLSNDAATVSNGVQVKFSIESI